MKEVIAENVMKQIRQSGDELVERIRAVHSRYWACRTDLVKTILGLTSAILVGTISFSGSLSGAGKESLECTWILYLSWLVFFCSICSGTVSLWHLYKLESLHAVFFNKTDEIEEKVKAIGVRKAEKELESEILKIVGEAVKESVSPATPSDKISHYSLFIQIGSFLIGLFVFMTFGVVQNA
ncbi:hypothetical protein [Shewanella sp. Isolate7]|uniref:hypothetical protein n=1 Tax=Shewanella sp. Isolate7 TaxID=2908528 RepID=UPI001EFC4958|nr:hypothetical protein [Shewanella sp. Isolate7]MCG9723186.1 hypothetical protein [Shewanella sp. Isolate7]